GVEGVTGLVVPAEDPQALAEAMARLHRDPALAERLGRAAQAAVRERFDGERLAGRLALLFQPLVASCWERGARPLGQGWRMARGRGWTSAFDRDRSSA